MHHIYSRRHLIAAALGLSSATRATAEEPKVEIPSYNTMSDADEVALGRTVAEGIEKEKKLTFIEVPAIRDYASRTFSRMVRTCARPGLPYSIKVVDTAEINAFSLPGGFVYLNRGLMEWARSDSEIAAVLGHEVGHVAGRHGANTISRMSMTNSLLSEASRVLFGDDLPARILKQVGGPMAFLALMKYSRTQEFEADLFGFYNMQRSGWSPQGMVELFRHFGEDSSAVDPLFLITSSHPLPADREAQILEELKTAPPRPGLTHDSDGYHAMQAAFKRLPPPPDSKGRR